MGNLPLVERSINANAILHITHALHDKASSYHLFEASYARLMQHQQIKVSQYCELDSCNGKKMHASRTLSDLMTGISWIPLVLSNLASVA